MDQRDFIGFSFNGVHSSDLGLYHVSDGNWYEEILHPEIEDRRNAVVGRDGEYYYGSDYRSKTITIQIAFDHVTETQFRQIGYLFSTKKPAKLIFDERPWKEYTVKLASPITLNYVCFDEPKITGTEERDGVRRERGVDEHGDPYNVPEKVYPYTYSDDTERIYKGEGSIELICSSPMARAPYKVLELYEETDMIHGNLVTAWNNVDEWDTASGILRRNVYNKYALDRVQEEEDGFSILTYNPGDIDTPFSLYIPFNEARKVTGDGGQFIVALPSGVMIFEEIESKDESGKETGIVINTANHLIEGVKYDKTEHESWSTTGNVYNEYLLKGYFPKIIHYGPFDLVTELNYKVQKLQVICDTSDIDIMDVRIFYDYLYY